MVKHSLILFCRFLLLGVIFFNWPLIAGGNLIVTGSNGQIAYYSPQGGKQISVTETGDSFSLSPLVVKGSLITLSDSATLTHWR